MTLDNRDRPKYEPLYEVDGNPHSIMDNLGDNVYRCQKCEWTGDFQDQKNGCTYISPPCLHCGLTPICAAACPGIMQLLARPDVYLAGSEPTDDSS